MISFAELEEVLKTIHEVFPLPVAERGEKFLGTHQIKYERHCETGELTPCFMVWFRLPIGIRCRTVYPDKGDVLNHEFFLEAKKAIEATNEHECVS